MVLVRHQSERSRLDRGRGSYKRRERSQPGRDSLRQIKTCTPSGFCSVASPFSAIRVIAAAATSMAAPVRLWHPHNLAPG
jgi:hypothetical protein